MGEAAASCPKCGTTRDESRTSCKSCGLAHDKMAAFEKARDVVPDALTTAWTNALEKWDDKARHDEILRLVTQHDAYAWIAALYRERIRDHADDDNAKKQLDRVRRAAEAAMMSSAATRQAEQPTPYRNTMAILALLVIIMVAGIVYAIARGRADKPITTTEPPPGTPAVTK